METKLNLDAYFSRIGYMGERAANLDVLKRLHLLHPQAITFENLNPLTGIPVLLDLKSIQQKLVHNRRGGYCFEQNLLFQHVLETLGFKVRGLGARILWNRPAGEITSRGHMLLLVELDGEKWIADVGFGGLGPTAPLQLKTKIEQETPHESYRLDLMDDYYVLQSHIKGEWKNLYQFGLERQYLADYEVTNWYLSNNPDSHFVTGLFAARPASGRRFTLRNHEFSIHYIDTETEKNTLQTISEIKKVLKEKFMITLPDTPILDQKLELLLKSAKSSDD